MVPLRSATTLLATPASYQRVRVPMIDRVLSAQLTMMVVSGSGAMRPARSTSSAPGTLTEPGMFMVAYSSKRRTSSTAILALSAIRSATSSAGSDGVCRRCSQFAKRLSVGIHILEQFIARGLPGLQSAVELPNVGISQCRKPIRRQGDQAFARIIEDDRHILAGQSRFGFERDPIGRRIGGKQRMARCKDGLVPHIEQRDFVRSSSAQRTCKGVTEGMVMGWAGSMRMAANLAQLRLPIQLGAKWSSLLCEERSDEAIHHATKKAWIASRSLSSGAHSRDPLARNDGEIQVRDFAVCFARGLACSFRPLQSECWK